MYCSPRVRRLATGVGLGDRVLDVACGTGVVARAALRRVGPDRSVSGLDVNHGMLQVAELIAPRVAWRHGRADALPYDVGTFDAASASSR